MKSEGTDVLRDPTFVDIFVAFVGLPLWILLSVVDGALEYYSHRHHLRHKCWRKP
jgi:hypothetical protein